MYTAGELWYLGCEWLVSNTFKNTAEVFEKSLSCYTTVPNATWDASSLMLHDTLNIAEIAKHYSSNTNVEFSRFEDAIRFFNRQFFNDTPLKITSFESQIASVIKRQQSNELDDLLKMDAIINVSTNVQHLLTGIALTYQDFYGAQKIANTFNELSHGKFGSLWQRAMVQTTNLQDSSYYEKFLTTTNDSRVQSVVRAVYLSELHHNNKFNASPCNTLFSYIYSDIRNIYDEEIGKCLSAFDLFPSVKDLVLFTASHLDISRGLLKIYITSQNVNDGLYSQPHFRNPIKLPAVFVSVLPEYRQSHLFHELGHFLASELFHYQQNFYTKIDALHNTARYQDFQKAKNDFVTIFHNSIFKSIQSNKTHSTFGIADIRKNVVVRAAIAFFHLELGELDKANRYMSSISILLNFSRSDSIERKQDILSNWIKNTWGLKQHKEVTFFIHRVFEWSLRHADVQDSELLNRLPELLSRNGQAAMIFDTLKPLAEYWDKYITPIIAKHPFVLTYQRTNLDIFDRTTTLSLVEKNVITLTQTPIKAQLKIDGATTDGPPFDVQSLNSLDTFASSSPTRVWSTTQSILTVLSVMVTSVALVMLPTLCARLRKANEDKKRI